MSASPKLVATTWTPDKPLLAPEVAQNIEDARRGSNHLLAAILEIGEGLRDLARTDIAVMDQQNPGSAVVERLNEGALVLDACNEGRRSEKPASGPCTITLPHIF